MQSDSRRVATALPIEPVSGIDYISVDGGLNAMRFAAAYRRFASISRSYETFKRVDA